MACLAEAKAVLQVRALEREAAARSAYQAKLTARKATARWRGGKLRELAPKPPEAPGPRPTDQYNFTDPNSRIMKQAQHAGFEQAYNGQMVVDQVSRFIVGQSLSNHPINVDEVAPTLDSIPAELGVPAAALDPGYWREKNVWEVESRGIVTGRQVHGRDWQAHFAPQEPPPLPGNATLRELMAHRSRMAAGALGV